MSNLPLLVQAFSIGNLLTSMLLAFFTLILLAALVRMSNYAGGEVSWLKKLKIAPKALKLEPLDYFQQYCRRNLDGTYVYSFSKHKSLRAASRLALNGSVMMLGLKVTVLAIFIGLQGGYHEAFAGRSGENYNIFIDSSSGGGGSSASGVYSLQSSFGDELLAPTSSSTNYQSNSGLIAIETEPSLGFTVAGGPVNFGALSPLTTSYSTHTISGFFNGNTGYDILLESAPPQQANGTALAPIGSTPQSPSVGTEQFGLNLTANTSPVSVGALPTGGHGFAAPAYAVPNLYAYQQGDVIASSDSRSANTTYTVTMIVNISAATPSGAYTGSVIYSIIPRF